MPRRHDRGGRPHRRGDARRSVPLRVTRVTSRRQQYLVERGKAADLPSEVAAAADYLRGALRRNAGLVEANDRHAITRLLDELAQHADRLYARAAKQARTESATPRRRRAA